MRASRLLAHVSILVLLLCTACAKKTKLDHFKFYKVSTPDFPASIPRIELKGQFDGSTRRTAVFVGLTHFGISVGKLVPDPTPTPSDQEPPEAPPEEESPVPPEQPPPPANPHHHLTWYALDEKKDNTPPHYAVVFDQFGRKELITGPAVAMLVPAHKVEEDSEAPQGLNHFKCYKVDRVRGETSPSVILRDQLDSARGQVDRAVLVRPDFLCVPVEKSRNRRVVNEIEKNVDDFDHLLVYRLEEPENYPGQKNVTDQIRDSVLTDFRSQYLGVPADKRLANPGREFPAGTPPG